VKRWFVILAAAVSLVLCEGLCLSWADRSILRIIIVSAASGVVLAFAYGVLAIALGVADFPRGRLFCGRPHNGDEVVASAPHAVTTSAPRPIAAPNAAQLSFAPGAARASKAWDELEFKDLPPLPLPKIDENR
jgi:hypothetical protein